MKNNIYKIATLIILIAMSAGCKKEFKNLNNPTDGDILTTKDGMISLSIGLKQVYATQALGALCINTGVTSKELKGTTTLANVIDLEAGGIALISNNANVAQVWNRMFRVMYMSEQVIDNAPKVLADLPQLKSGIIAHAQMFKAMTLGGLAVAFQNFPQSTSQGNNATYVSRNTALVTALDLLAQAKATLVATAPSAEFNTKVIGADFNMIDIINALSARYNLWLKRYPEAFNAASSVNLSNKSQFIYTTQGQNPLFTGSVLSTDYRPREFFGLPASLTTATDTRLAFYADAPTLTSGGELVKTMKGFGGTATTIIPVFLPDEMRLIKAEAILLSATPIGSTTNPASVLAEIDAVRTQTTGDPFGVYANLPAYAGATDVASLTTEIYKQRCMELFCSGNKLEDSRRLGRLASFIFLTERNRDFYPYPDQERQNNPNTPADPLF